MVGVSAAGFFLLDDCVQCLCAPDPDSEPQCVCVCARVDVFIFSTWIAPRFLAESERSHSLPALSSGRVDSERY